MTNIPIRHIMMSSFRSGYLDGLGDLSARSTRSDRSGRSTRSIQSDRLDWIALGVLHRALFFRISPMTLSLQCPHTRMCFNKLSPLCRLSSESTVLISKSAHLVLHRVSHRVADDRVFFALYLDMVLICFSISVSVLESSVYWSVCAVSGGTYVPYRLSGQSGVSIIVPLDWFA